MRGTPSIQTLFFLRLTENLASLFSALYTPTLWSYFANEQAFALLVSIFQAAQAFNIPYNTTYHIPSGTVDFDASLFKSGTAGFGSNPVQNLTNHAFEAIVGADDWLDTENHVVMGDVLDEIVYTTQNVTPTCK